MNGTGSLVIRAEKVGSATVLSQIVQLVAQAPRSRAPMQRMADKVSFWFVLAVLAAAVATLLVWSLFGPEPSWTYAVLKAVSVRSEEHTSELQSLMRTSDPVCCLTTKKHECATSSTYH